MNTQRVNIGIAEDWFNYPLKSNTNRSLLDVFEPVIRIAKSAHVSVRDNVAGGPLHFLVMHASHAIAASHPGEGPAYAVGRHPRPVKVFEMQYDADDQFALVEVIDDPRLTPQEEHDYLLAGNYCPWCRRAGRDQDGYDCDYVCDHDEGTEVFVKVTCGHPDCKAPSWRKEFGLSSIEVI